MDEQREAIDKIEACICALTEALLLLDRGVAADFGDGLNLSKHEAKLILIKGGKSTNGAPEKFVQI